MSVGHRQPPSMPIAERLALWSEPEPNSGCHLWLGSRSDVGTGLVYGSIKAARFLGPRSRLVHRVAYETFVGPIPDGLTIDHLCRNTLCINPAHLEPVTRGENLLRGNAMGSRHARKTHCDHGHPFDAENTRLYKGKRLCRTCHRTRAREAAAAKRQVQESTA